MVNVVIHFSMWCEENHPVKKNVLSSTLQLEMWYVVIMSTLFVATTMKLVADN